VRLIRDIAKSLDARFSSAIVINNERTLNPPKAQTLLALCTDLLLQVVLTTACVVAVLRLWKADLNTPFNYWGDTLYQLALVKSIADGGWIWFVERLGAPFGLEAAAFPQNMTFSSAVMKGIAFFTSEPGLILNLFWLATIPLTAGICHLSMRALSVSRSASFVVSTLYALLPYAFYRNTAHIVLTYFFAPVIAAYCVEVLAGVLSARRNHPRAAHIPRWLLTLACVAIGFDYIYNAFFACFFLLAAAIASFVSNKDITAVKRVLPAIGLVCICTGINLAPSFISWKQGGIPPDMGYKTPAEAEIYGLKLRHVVSPIFTQNLPVGLDKRGLAVTFPIENENTTAKLGAVGAIGFLLALWSALFGRRRHSSRLAWAAGVLTVFGTLLATIGGFGAIFNLLVVPDIRAYNRIIVFLAFFSFFVFATYLNAAFDKLRAALLGQEREYWFTPAVLVLLSAILLGGVWDQGHAATPLVERYSSDQTQMFEERDVVYQIERLNPPVKSVYQLPDTTFPPDGGRECMLTYDHARPYLWSSHVRWSWPGFSNRRQAWAAAIGRPEEDQFLSKLVMSGFEGVWVDRFGYRSEELNALETNLIQALGNPLVISSNARYVFFSLQPIRAAWLKSGTEAERAEASSNLLEPLLPRFSAGFYEEEVAPDARRRHRWSRAASEITFRNPYDRARRLEMRALVQGRPGASLAAKLGSESFEYRFVNDLLEVVIPIAVVGGGSVSLEFSYSGKKIDAPGDPREMFFAVINPVFKEVN
jgi:phosphoglycerol transferase